SMEYWQFNHEANKNFVVNLTGWTKNYTTDSGFELSTGMPAYPLASMARFHQIN
ncbi:8583_t:CDS:1, partial [Entrophospora sp. SA101]